MTAVIGGLAVIVGTLLIVIFSPDTAAPVRILVTAMGIGAGAFEILRVSRAGVIVDSKGLIVRNAFRTRRLPWTNIRDFSVGRHGFHSRVGIATLKNGERVKLWAVQGPNPLVRPKNTHAEDIVRELNHILVSRAT